jgi:exopolysaccharide biosynthesis polyprenyl glycosylphosphotransferase
MNLGNKREALTLFIGDIIFLVFSLWLTLSIRAGEFPAAELFYSILYPFVWIFLVSFMVFYIAGLYEKHTVILKSRLPFKIFRTQLITSFFAIAFFYFIPYFGITPKTVLFIYIFISSILIVFWRLYLFNFFIYKRNENALIIGAGKEVEELVNEINKNGNYGMRFVESINLDEDITNDELKKKIIDNKNFSIIVIDLYHDQIQPILPDLYNLIFYKITFVAMYKVYEDVFKRVPFFILQYNWFLENISSSPKVVYDTLKRLVDILLSFIGSLITFFVVLPFVWIAIKLDDNKSLFIIQQRIGQGGRVIKLLKFRSMITNDHDRWAEQNDQRITRVGKFLRKSRIDELPQFWNVLIGNISIIGPRPDIYGLGMKLREEIPYYTVRNIIKPGLSGWAQINQELPPQSLEETKIRLAYDLYYVKNRSFILDVQIILKTISTLLSRSGR